METVGDEAALLEAYGAWGTRERAAMLRALLELEQGSLAARLAAEVPHDSLALLDLQAQALLDAGRADEALRVVEAREAKGTSSISLGLRARALAATGRADEARAALRSSEGLDAYVSRCIEGELLLESDDAAGARAALEAAVALHPYRRRALHGLVRACHRTGDHVHGSAFAARLLDSQEGEEGSALTARQTHSLREFYQAAGEENRLREADALLAARRQEAALRLDALVRGEKPAPRPDSGRAPQAAPEVEQVPAPSSPEGPVPSPQAPVVVQSDAPPVTDEERARVGELMRRYMGFDALREGQAETMARVLRGEDVLAVMPTGGGKSVCYQLPAVLEPGVTLVVSPLIALMKDQLDGLPAPMRAAAASLTSELSPTQMRHALDELAQGRYRLVYVAPERLRQAPLLRALRKAGVKRLVVDEAHCVSVWGHDFRPDYLQIAEARRNLGNPPLLAMTATAPPRVLRDIQQRLGEQMTLVRVSVERPNLRFEGIVCKSADDKLAHLYTLCRDEQKPGIVYASSRAKCEQLAEALRGAGLNAEAYHALHNDRSRRQEDFMENRTDILVATVAFGMGVDKGDIRFVFHHDPSSSVENYYQEAGRAGRDGKPARCVVLATGQDGGTLKTRGRQDLPSRDLISHVWSGVLARTGPPAGAPEGYALVPLEDLQDLAQEKNDVKPRVALSVLTEAGAVERIADVPMRFRVRSLSDARLAAFDKGNATVFDLAPALDVPPELVEATLLEREERGELRYQATGRAQLLRVHGDTSRIEGVLERYVALAEQRSKEIMDYVKTRRCRHRYLRAYFGEEAPERCGQCDVCLGVSHEADDVPGADDETAARHILDALASMRGIGQLNLVWMLRGDARAPEWTMGRPGFGALAFRSEASVRQVVDRAQRHGLVETETLDHGGKTLKITHAGLRAMQRDAPVLPERKARPAPAATGAPVPGDAAPPSTEPSAVVDEPLLDALKAWRRERADADGVPSYVVAHNAMLQAIAAARPRTEEELLAVKGMGAKRVEKYGKDLLAVVAAGSSE